MQDTRNAPIEVAAQASYDRWAEDLPALLSTAHGESGANDDEMDMAREDLEQSVLDVSRLSRHFRLEEDTWEILISTGGPASRVLVTTDYDGEVAHAEYQYQGWFTPWTAADNQDSDLVESFARVFCFYTEDQR